MLQIAVFSHARNNWWQALSLSACILESKRTLCWYEKRVLSVNAKIWNDLPVTAFDTRNIKSSEKAFDIID